MTVIKERRKSIHRQLGPNSQEQSSDVVDASII